VAEGPHQIEGQQGGQRSRCNPLRAVFHTECTGINADWFLSSIFPNRALKAGV
jgi:hypothetical protein